jgi:hypothetical protein
VLRSIVAFLAGITEKDIREQQKIAAGRVRLERACAPRRQDEED